MPSQDYLKIYNIKYTAHKYTVQKLRDLFFNVTLNKAAFIS